MAATGIRWWIVIPLVADGRRLGLLHFGLRPGARRAARGRCWTSCAPSATAPPARWSPRS